MVGDDRNTLAMGTEGPRGQEVEALEWQTKLKEAAPGPGNHHIGAESTQNKQLVSQKSHGQTLAQCQSHLLGSCPFKQKEPMPVRPELLGYKT